MLFGYQKIVFDDVFSFISMNILDDIYWRPAAPCCRVAPLNYRPPPSALVIFIRKLID
jgi:hypothetical protein